MNLFNAVFRNSPSSPAIRFDGRTITYGELRAETSTMAQVINSLGVASGDRVALLLHDSPQFIEAETCRTLLTHAPEKLQALKNAVVVERPGRRDCYDEI